MPALPIAPRSLAAAALGIVATFAPALGQDVTVYPTANAVNPTGGAPSPRALLPAPDRIGSRLIPLPERIEATQRSPLYSESAEPVTVAPPPPPRQVATVSPAPTARVEPPAMTPPVAAPAARPPMSAALTPELDAPSPKGAVTGTVPFAPGAADLNEFVKADLDRVAKSIADRKVRGIEVHAYAGDGEDPNSRKVALARALVVRSYLIDRGVKAKIEVGAFSGVGERVDILVPNP
ncbi:MAG: OmpA family protein [Reyranellaceae bacterium]